MKKLKRIIPLILTAICLLVMPMNAKGLDFGNYAGDEDFSYDSNWQVEEKTTAAQYTGSVSDDSDDGCSGCGVIMTSDTFDWAIDNITALSQKTK